ncbi:MAG: hypothetical protein CME31_05795 [Gimesia sp.]|jgi:hypothetical protein|nr:hypothetical protein [Gimesia sp.]|tara:strand:- start:2580 stop:2858 length:279 start_codon:yes stop_codon:yes gene_type:complete
MNTSKRKISMRERIKTLEDTVNNMTMGTINSLVRAVSVLGSTFEEYIAMKNDTEKFVKHLEKVIKNENKSSDTREKKSSKGSGTTKTSGKNS